MATAVEALLRRAARDVARRATRVIDPSSAPPPSTWHLTHLPTRLGVTFHGHDGATWRLGGVRWVGLASSRAGCRGAERRFTFRDPNGRRPFASGGEEERTVATQRPTRRRPPQHRMHPTGGSINLAAVRGRGEPESGRHGGPRTRIRDGTYRPGNRTGATSGPAASTRDVLLAASARLGRMNHVGLSAIFNKLGKAGSRAPAAGGRCLARDEPVFKDLLRLTRRLAERGTLDAFAVSNITGGIARLHVAGCLDVEDENVRETLSALEGAFGVLGNAKAQNVANTLWSMAKMGWRFRDDAWEALEHAARHVAGEMNARDVAIAMYAVATLDRLPGDDAWEALENAAGRVAPGMDAQGVANTLWAYGTMRRTPGDEARGALERAVNRVARIMTSQNVVNVLWAFARLGRMPQGETWKALEIAAFRVARDMSGPSVSNAMWAYATLAQKPDDPTLGALEYAVRRGAQDMSSQNVANTLNAYAKLNQMPRDRTWEALESAVVRVAPDMSPQEVANTVWAYAKLGRLPGADVHAALESATGRVAPIMGPQEVAISLWSHAAFSALRNAELPSTYSALWRRACAMNVHDFSVESKATLFHAKLMNDASDSLNRSAEISCPAWLPTHGRDAWDSHRTTISKFHRELAKAFEELGIRHVSEHLTDDGLFSMDLYLPDHDVAVEADGYRHYYNDRESTFPARSSRLRTVTTELRDFFLDKRCAKVVTVPWFEWQLVKNSGERRRSYLKAKLSEEAGIQV